VVNQLSFNKIDKSGRTKEVKVASQNISKKIKKDQQWIKKVNHRSKKIQKSNKRSKKDQTKLWTKLKIKKIKFDYVL